MSRSLGEALSSLTEIMPFHDGGPNPSLDTSKGSNERAEAAGRGSNEDYQVIQSVENLSEVEEGSDIESIRAPSNSSSGSLQEAAESLRLSASSGEGLSGQIFSSFEMVMAKLDQILETQRALQGDREQLAWLALKVDELAGAAEGKVQRVKSKRARRRSEDMDTKPVRSESDSVLEDAAATRRFSECRVLSFARDVKELQTELRRRVLNNCSEQLAGATTGPEAIWGRRVRKATRQPFMGHRATCPATPERQMPPPRQMSLQRTHPLVTVDETSVVLPGMPQENQNSSPSEVLGAGVGSASRHAENGPSHRARSPVSAPQSQGRVSSGLSDSGEFRGPSKGFGASFSSNRARGLLSMEALRREQNQRIMAEGAVASLGSLPPLQAEVSGERQQQQEQEEPQQQEQQEQQEEQQGQQPEQPQELQKPPQQQEQQQLDSSPPHLCRPDTPYFQTLRKLPKVTQRVAKLAEAGFFAFLYSTNSAALWCAGLHRKPISTHGFLHSKAVWAVSAVGKSLVGMLVASAAVWMVGGGFGLGHVHWPERLLAAGSLAAFAGMWVVAKRHQEGRELLLKFGEATGFDGEWDKQAAICSAVFWLLWLLAVGLKFVMPSSGLEVAAFAAVSGAFFVSAHSIVNSCRGLGLQIDSFCLHLGVRSLALDLAVRNWNVVQACLRDFGEAMQVPFTALMLTFFSCSLAMVAEATGSDEVVLTPLLPCAVLLIATPGVLGFVSLVTGKCQKVHSFVNSLERDQAMDLERQYLVDYIQKSGAGFYIWDLCFTGTLAWRIIYTTLTAAFVSSRFWPMLSSLNV